MPALRPRSAVEAMNTPKAWFSRRRMLTPRTRASKARAARPVAKLTKVSTQNMIEGAIDNTPCLVGVFYPFMVLFSL